MQPASRVAEACLASLSGDHKRAPALNIHFAPLISHLRGTHGTVSRPLAADPISAWHAASRSAHTERTLAVCRRRFVPRSLLFCASFRRALYHLLHSHLAVPVTSALPHAPDFFSNNSSLARSVRPSLSRRLHGHGRLWSVLWR